MARYVISPLAEQDIEAIGDYIAQENYIAQDNPHRALTFIAELRSQCAKLSASPQACRLRPELGESIRSYAFGNYVIFVLHGAMDIETRFSEE
jgi:toxin ParE1/3/4